MAQPRVAVATAEPQSYLRQAEVDGRRLRDVHDLTVRRHNKDEAVQRLKGQRGSLDGSHDSFMNSLSTPALQQEPRRRYHTHFLFGISRQ